MPKNAVKCMAGQLKVNHRLYSAVVFLCFVRDFKVLFIVNVCFIKSLNLGGNGGKIRLFSIRKYRIYHGRRY